MIARLTVNDVIPEEEVANDDPPTGEFLEKQELESDEKNGMWFTILRLPQNKTSN